MTKAQLAYYARNYLFAFPKLVSGNKNPFYLKFIANTIQEAIGKQTTKKQLVIISAPPRHGKSELMSIHAPPWIQGNYPNHKIIIASYSASLSQKHSARGKDIFEKWGPILWNIKPNPSQYSREFWTTEKGGEVKAIGIGGGATGFGADDLFIEDYHSDPKEAESKVYRETNWDWWQAVANTRLHPHATVVIFSVRWHEDDLIGRILKQKKEEGDRFPFDLKYVNLPAIAEEADPLGREPGEALWPWWADEEQLEFTKGAVGSHVWSALFQGHPSARGGTLFLRDNFRYWYIDGPTGDFICVRKEREPIRIKKQAQFKRHVKLDPSIEEKKTSDPTGMAAWYYSDNHRVWLLNDVCKEIIPHTKISFTALNFAFKNKCTEIGCENEKLGKVLVKQSAGNDEIGGIKIPFVEVKIGKLDKYARATTMANYMENERVFFKRDAPWLADYEDELVKFPRGEHDEAVDITSMADEMETKMSVAEALRGRGN